LKLKHTSHYYLMPRTSTAAETSNFDQPTALPAAASALNACKSSSSDGIITIILSRGPRKLPKENALSAFRNFSNSLVQRADKKVDFNRFTRWNYG